MGTHLSVCDLPKKHQNNNNNNMDWPTLKIDGPSLWNAIQTAELNKAELHTPNYQLLLATSMFKYQRPAFVGRGLVIPWPIYPKAKLWVEDYQKCLLGV